MHDLRYAVRVFARRPYVAVFAIVTLSIGLAAAIAAFAVVDRVVLRDPAVTRPDRLVMINEFQRDEPTEDKQVSPADFHDLRNSGAFSSASVWMKWNYTLSGQGMPQRLRGVLVSPELFTTLGVKARLGRTLLPSDGASAVVISHAVWQRVFGSDPAIAGKTVRVSGEPATVIGVMPEDFAYPADDTDMWTPLIWGVHFNVDDREGRNLRMVARLRDGVSIEQSTVVVQTVMGRIAASSPATHRGWSARVKSLREALTHELRPTLLALLGAAAAMFIVAAANTMNLLLMMAASRRRELATRLALGARWLRLAREAIAEGLVLGVAAAVVAIVLAAGALRLAGALSLPLPDVALDTRSIVAGVLAALVAGIAATLIPLLLFRRSAPEESLRTSHQVLAPGGRLRNGFVVAQIALTCTMLVSAGALVKSFRELMSIDTGFETRGVVTANLFLGSRYDTAAKQIAFTNDVLERLSRQPGVAAVGTIQDLPLRGNAMSFDVTVDDDRTTKAAYRVASENYFATLEIPILRGRAFASSDAAGTPLVFIVNRAMATRVFGKSDPIGRRLKIDDGEWGRVVGVAGDVRHMGLDSDEIAAVYQPLRQKPHDWLRWTTLVVRAQGNSAASLGPLIGREVMALDPEQPVFEVMTMESLLARHVARPRAAAWVISALGAIALLVALIGTAAALSYAVTLRMRELAIRVAVGARPGELVALVLRHAALLVCTGVAAGIAIAVALSPILRTLLFRVSPLEPVTIAVIAGSILGAAALAALVPARRAAVVDPAITLRME